MDMKILSQQFCDHATYIKGLSPDTTLRYKQVINIFCNRGNIENLADINDNNVRGFFVTGRTKYKWKPATFISYHNTLTVFFTWCIKEKHLASNPLVDIEVPKLYKSLPTKLTRQEALRLLEVVYNYPYPYKFLRYRNHAIFAAFLFAGLRRKELLNLKFADVDLENLTLFVRQGKGNKDRIIPMSYRLAEILKTYLRERMRLGKTCPEFFTSLNRDMGFKTIGLKRLVDKMKEVSGLKFSSHKLRHTFATLMLEGGCDIYSLSKMMGHSDIKTTTIYLSASAEHLRGQMIKHPLNNM
jgi:site-specific recombinase XerD